MSQVQCPNCGGFRVETTTSTSERKTGITTDFGGSQLAVSLLFAVGFVFGGYWAATLGGVFGSIDSPTFLDTILGIGSIGTGLFIALYTIKLYIKNVRADKVICFHNTCSLCGYKWTQRNNEPLPPVHVQQDLIAKGAQRLEEEEEDWRRRAAAAAYLQSQQRPKK